jgi:hypothetical protein
MRSGASPTLDHGYALTVHKAQGSQGTQLCCSTKAARSASVAPPLYIGLTRAARRLTLVR